MRIGILECDHVDDRFHGIDGDYTDPQTRATRLEFDDPDFDPGPLIAGSNGGDSDRLLRFAASIGAAPPPGRPQQKWPELVP